MTTPSIVKRRLTFHFERSVNAVTGKPNTMEVVVGALANPTSAVTNTTFVDDPQSKVVVLGGDDNTAVFELVPTDDPSLSERLLYRVAWRSSYLGKQYSYDFAMPDRDVDFDDLFGDLQSILDWHVYLQQSDLGVPGRVAKLNTAGQVVDAAGVPVTGDVAASVVQGNLDAEVVNRQQADRDLRLSLESQMTSQFNSVVTSTQASLERVVEDYQLADTSERATRLQQIGAINTSLNELASDTATQISALQAQTDTLPQKADLGEDGKLLTSQLPDISLGHAVTVANQAAMLALTSAQVQPGDFAVRPDGVWYLNAPAPHELSSWVKFTVAPLVTSINGQSGDVTLSATDVGARPVDAQLAIGDTAGLQAALDGKAGTSALTALSTRVTGTENRLTAIEAPTSAYVRTSNGVVPTTLLGADVPRLSGGNVLVNSQGNPISIIGSGAVDSVNGMTGVVVLDAADVGARPAGTALNIVEVTGLGDALAGKVSTGDARLTDARTPTAHASSHAANGSDPITPSSIGARASATPVPIADVQGLQTALDSKGALTAVNQQATRLYALETRVDSLEGEGGFGGVSAFKVEAWDAPALLTPVSVPAFATDVVFKSPFGKSVESGGYYYDPTGAAAGESVWPYISPNGHLELRQWNEANPADVEYAPLGDFTALSSTVAGKADSSTVTALSSTVAGKASQADLDALTSTVAGKASQSSVDTLSGQLAAKASQSDFDALTSTVAGKASGSDLTALTGRVTTAETTLTSKADLSGGKVPVNQIPTGIPQANITGLSGSFAAKADLVGNVVPLAQLPALPISQVTNLQTTLNGKADLDPATGKLSTSQLPAVSLTNAQAVANRTAMLALNTAQVQPGDICVISSGADQGTYVLTAADPSVFANWLKLTTPADAVSSVNGQTGVVVLSAANVGARASNVSIPQADITGLAGSLALKADTAVVDPKFQARPTWSVTSAQSTLESILTNSAPIKLVADFTTSSTTNPTALTWPFSGYPTIDGVVTTGNKIVLVNNQSDSTQNGLWKTGATSATPWSRVDGMTSGNYFLLGSLVLVRSGNSRANTFWQQTSASGIVGTNNNNWSFAMQAGPSNVYTASSTGGLLVSSNAFGVKLPTDSGLYVTSLGLQVDRQATSATGTPSYVPYKWAGWVPASTSTLVPITHNLNTTDVSVTVMDDAGDVKLLGWTATSANVVTLEFGTAPNIAETYRCVVMG